MSVSLGNATSNASYIARPVTRKILKSSNGTLLYFYIDKQYIRYKTSSDDGVTWDVAWTAAYTQPEGREIGDLDVAIDGSDNIYCSWNYSGWDLYPYFLKLSYSAGVWTPGSAVVVYSESHHETNIVVRANGDLWIVGFDGGQYVRSYYSTDGGANWNKVTNFNLGTNCTDCSAIAVGDDVWCFIRKAYNNTLVVTKYTTSWSATETVTSDCVAPTTVASGSAAGTAAISSSEVYVAANTSTGIKAYKYTGTWDAGTEISATAEDENPAVSIVAGKPVVVWTHWDGTRFQIAYRTWNGASWDTKVDVTSNAVVHNTPHAIETAVDTLYYGWWEGASAGEILFDKVDLSLSIKQEIYSDVSFKSPSTEILSDIYFVSHTEDLLSDVKFQGTELSTILSDAKFSAEVLYNVNNKVGFVSGILYDISNKFSFVNSLLSDINNFINTAIRVISDTNNDFRMRGLGIFSINNDIRFLKSYQIPGAVGFQSLGKTYIHVYFNNVEQTDVNVDSIEIHKILNGAHTASLDLARAYDVNVPVLETVVTIYYDSNLLYKGYITEINPTEAPENINIICNDKYWYQNRTTKYFFVGHEPIENVAPNIVETYYPTPKTALATEVGLNVDFGNFVPQTIGCFGTPESDAISSLIDASGNFGWYYDVDDTKKIWRAGQGTVIDINRQVLGSNIKLYDLLNHQFKKDASNVINKFRVQMGNRTYVGSREYSSYTFRNYAKFVNPAWDTSIPLISSNDDVSTWVNHSAEDASLYTDVLKKYTLPYLDPKLEQYADNRPSYVEIYSRGGTFGFVGPLNLQYEKTLYEGFTIDFENRTITFNDPMFLYQPDANGEPINISQPIIKVFLWKKVLSSHTDDPVNNPLVFYTPKMGSYPVTITKELNLSDLSISDGATWKYYDGVTHQIPQYDDTAFATDIAKWNLSKTQEERINGNIEVTLDTLCYYGIDLTKRININGITTAPMNILSIDIKLNDFKVSVNLDNSQPYQRTISMSYRGE